MASPVSARNVAKFDRFQVRLSSGELLRDGVRVPIQEKPFSVLRLLLEAEGRVVTREKLRTALWPEDTFVDFDLGMNTAVKKVRQALDDSADHPRYIETLPKIGYRFVCTAEWTSEERKTVPQPNPSLDEAVRAYLEPTNSDTSRLVLTASFIDRRKKRFPSPLAIGILLGILLLACIGAGLFFLASQRAVPTASNFVQLTHDGLPKTLRGTDGARLYLRLGNSIRFKVGEVSVAGGDPREIPIADSTSSILLAVKPDNDELLMIKEGSSANDGPLWTVPSLGGSPRRLADLHGRDGSWSADGKRLAYADLGELFVANADGTDSRKIASFPLPNRVLTPQWSSNGTLLRFTLSEEAKGTVSIWQVSSNGTDVHSLFPDWDANLRQSCCGKWTANGKYFVFESQGQIWALANDNDWLRSRPRPLQLTSSPIRLSDPVPSKDGEKLFVIGQTHRGELVRFDRKSGEFSPFLGGISAEMIDFSKDGKWVAYVTFPEGCLWRSRSDGTDAVQLTFPPDHALMPRWSPDGKSIAFYFSYPGKLAKIFEVSASGGTPHRLIPNDESFQSDPIWSLDGNSVLFGGSASDPTSVIRLFDLKTKQISILPGSQGYFSPRLDPAGRYIAALSGDQSTLLLFDRRTEKWAPLSSIPGGFPNFSKDGKFIYVLGNPVRGGVFRIRIADAKLEEVADLTNFITDGLNHSALALAPDDSLLLLRNAGTHDVYALDWKSP